ncbi:MAG TPA: enolase C-terminal domain-like protein [Steroidobacteraceae bacterium]|nr:enolase C-terminal domain-like protein [Steroidobacteraceae bacterium]
MKITGVQATWVPDATANRSLARGICVVEVATDAALTGFAIGSSDVRVQLSAITDSLLVDEDPRGVTGLWERMFRASRQDGDDALCDRAMALLDVALWDLKAKANGEPLWKALGGTRPRINVNASAARVGASDDELERWCGSMVQTFGIRSASLVVGVDSESNLRRLELMRKTLASLTPEPGLMIDAQGSWEPKEAIRRVREMEERFDLTWVGTPTRGTDFLGLKRVSNAIRAAVCAGGSLGAPPAFLPHFHHHALDIVQVGVANAGITGALQLADTAFGFELPVALSASPGHVNAHLGAVMPNCMSLEVLDIEPRAAGFKSDVRIESGWAIAGDRPGHGLVIERSLS